MNARIKSVLNVFVLLILVGLVIFVPSILKIWEVDCVSQFGPCNPLIENKISKVKSRSLKDAKKQLKEVLTKDVLVKNFSVQFTLPDRLKINVLERKPKFATFEKDRGSVALIDEEGYIVAIESQTNLPTIETNILPGNVGEKVNDEIFFALKLIDSLFSKYQVKEGKIENGTFIIELKEGETVIFPLEGDSDLLISSLELVLKKFESEKVKPKVIDLRFKNPVTRD